MTGYLLQFRTTIVPKKNAFRAGVTSDGRKYQYRLPKARESQKGLHEEAFYQARAQNIRKPLTGNLGADIVLKKTKADAIGLVETILDALEDVIYENDRQIVDCRYRWDFEGKYLQTQDTAKVFIYPIK